MVRKITLKPVTVGEQANNDAYEPTTEEVTKDYGTPTTEDDVTGAVTIPNYPAEKEENQQSQWMIQVNYQTVIHQVKQSRCDSEISRWYGRSH